MNIAIDIDDTLTNSFEYFQPYVAEYFGTDPSEARKAGISYSNLPKEWAADEIGFCRRYFDSIAEYTPFKPDAADGVRRLRAAGHRIIIITGRTKLLYTDPYETTRRELINGNIEYDRLICTFDKEAACRKENIALLIDDMPRNCEAAQRAGAAAVLFDSAANRKAVSRFPRVYDWDGAVCEVERILSKK